MTPELDPAPHVHSGGHPACTPKLQLHTQPVHSHHLATAQAEACAQGAQSNPRWATGKSSHRSWKWPRGYWDRECQGLCPWAGSRGGGTGFR